MKVRWLKPLYIWGWLLGAVGLGSARECPQLFCVDSAEGWGAAIDHGCDPPRWRRLHKQLAAYQETHIHTILSPCKAFLNT